VPKQTFKSATALALVAGAVAMTAVGCVQSPVERTGFVGYKHRLVPPAIKPQEIRGRYIPLDMVFRNPEATLSGFTCLYIAPPQWRCPVPDGLKPEDQAKILRHLRHRLHVHMSAQNCFDLVTKNIELLRAVEKRYKVCRLETAITSVDLGDPWLRYIVGLDLGGVDVQQEGQFLDAKGGQVLIEYADRRIEGGSPRFGFGLSTFDAAKLVLKSIGIQALGVAQFVRYHKGPLPPEPVAAAAVTQRLHDIRY